MRRRRQQQQQQAAAAAAAAAAAQPQQAQDSSTGNLHDEADVMSFRAAATQRFMLNQEWIENVTDKNIPVWKIAKPRSFPQQTEKQSLAELGKTDIYFGNLALMKQKLAEITKDVDALSSELGHEHHEQNELQGLVDRLDNQLSNEEINEVSSEFSRISHKFLVDKPFTLKQVPSLRSNKDEAPEGYWDKQKQASSKEPAQDIALAEQLSLPDDMSLPPQEPGLLAGLPDMAGLPKDDPQLDIPGDMNGPGDVNGLGDMNGLGNAPGGMQSMPDDMNEAADKDSAMLDVLDQHLG